MQSTIRLWFISVLKTKLCGCKAAWDRHPDAFSSSFFPMLLPPNFVPSHVFWQAFLLGWSLMGILNWSFFNHGAQQRVTHFGLWGKCGEMKPELKLAQELGNQGCFFRCQQGEWISHNYLRNLREQFRHMWCMKADLIGVIFLGRGS